MLQQRLIQRVQVGEAFQVENRVAGERFQVAENYRVFFYYALISFSPHFYTNKDIDMRSFVTCSRHRVVFL